MSIWSRLGTSIARRFQGSSSQNQSVAQQPRATPPKANVLTQAATSRGAGSPLTSSISRSQSPAPPAAFNPSTPFGSSLPANVQKAPSTPRGNAPRSSGGGGGSSSPSQSFSTPQDQSLPFDPSQTLAPELPTPELNTPQDAFGAALSGFPAGAQLNATALDKLKFGLDISGVAGTVKGAQLTNAFVKQVWKRKGSLATEKVLLDLGVKAERIAAGEGIEGLVEVALKATPQELNQLGKAAINTKNTRQTISYLTKLSDAAKNPRVVLGFLIATLSTVGGALVFSRLMNPNAKGDVALGLRMTMKEATDSNDPVLVNETLQLINDTNTALEEADGVLGDWSPLKYGKTELIKWKNLRKDADIMNRSMNIQIQEEADNRAYWEETRNMQAERDQRYEEQKEIDQVNQQAQNEYFIQLQKQKDDAIAARDKKLARDFDRRLKNEEKAWAVRQARIEERDALLREQRLTEWDAKVAEFNRQQKIFMENWAKRQKYYQEQRGSNLGFGLFR